MTAGPRQPGGEPDAQAAFRSLYDSTVRLMQAAQESGGGAASLRPAIGGFDRVVELAPDSPVGYLGRGYAHGLAGDDENAMEDFGRAIERGGGLPQVYATRARYFEMRLRLDEALHDYDAAVERSPQDQLLRRDRASVRLTNGDWTGALEDLDVAVTIDPGLLDARRMRAAIRTSLGHHEEALAELDALIALGDESATVYRDRGNAHGAAGDVEAAIADFTTAVERDPSLTDAYLGRAHAYSRLPGHDDEAVADYSEALELNPVLVKAYRRRAEAYQRLGRPEDAVADLDRFIELGADSAEAYCLRARVREDAGDIDGALEDYTSALGRDSTSLAGYLGRGRVHLVRGAAEVSLADYDAAVSVDPRCPDAYIGRGAAYQALGDPEQAKWDHARAIELEPASPEARRGLILARLAMGDEYHDRRLLGKADGAYRKALRDADDGLKAVPGDHPLRMCRAAALRALGACDRALDDLRSLGREVAPGDDATLARLHAEAAQVLIQWSDLVGDSSLLEQALDELDTIQPADTSASMLALELAGTALTELERYDEALERFEAVAAEAPSAASALLGAGKVHLLRGEPSDALRVFARLLQASTGRDALDRWARVGRALALRRLGDPGAESAAERAIRRARDAPSYVERGTRLEFFGAFAEAEDDFRMAIELEPGWGASKYALARNLLERDARRDVVTEERQEVVDEARRLAVFAIENQGAGAAVPHYRQTAGRACLRLGRNDEALEHLRDAAKLNPDHVGIRNDLAAAERLRSRAKHA